MSKVTQMKTMFEQITYKHHFGWWMNLQKTDILTKAMNFRIRNDKLYLPDSTTKSLGRLLGIAS
jgi:hypothetical protein